MSVEVAYLEQSTDCTLLRILTGANLLEKDPWYATCTEVNVSCSVGHCGLSHGDYRDICALKVKRDNAINNLDVEYVSSSDSYKWCSQHSNSSANFARSVMEVQKQGDFPTALAAVVGLRLLVT